MVGAFADLAGEVGLANAKALEAWAGAFCAPVMRAYVWKRFPLGPGGLLCASTSPTLSVERTVAVLWASRIDAEGDALVPRSLAGVLFAVVGVYSRPVGKCVIDVYFPTSRYTAPSAVVAVGGHGASPPHGHASGADRRQENSVDDIDSSHVGRCDDPNWDKSL